MYKGFMIHNHDLKFHARDINEEKETNKEKPESNSTDYDTARKFVKGKDGVPKKIH